MWDRPGSGIELMSPALAGGFFTTEPPRKPAFFSDSVIVNQCETNIILKIFKSLPPDSPVCKTKTRKSAFFKIHVLTYNLFYKIRTHLSMFL